MTALRGRTLKHPTTPTLEPTCLRCARMGSLLLSCFQFALLLSSHKHSGRSQAQIFRRGVLAWQAIPRPL